MMRGGIKLSDRLLMSVTRVTGGYSVADVGCDHAHSSIWLVKNGISPYVVAMDLRKGPLSRAEENVRLFGCEGVIKTRLSDGLDMLAAGETDTILICGMGGKLTRDILAGGLEQTRMAKELVLQPQSDYGLVRAFLHGNGFSITDEAMCLDGGKYYTVIKAANKCMTDAEEKTGYDGEYTYDMSIRYGRLLLERRDAVLKEYMDMEHRKLLKVKEQLENGNTKNTRERMSTITNELNIIEAALRLYR